MISATNQLTDLFMKIIRRVTACSGQAAAPGRKTILTRHVCWIFAILPVLMLPVQATAVPLFPGQVLNTADLAVWTASMAMSVTTADFNGDGKADMAVANQITNTVSVSLGDGTGGFKPAVNFAVGTSPYSVTSADFNGDGNADMAVANLNSSNVGVLLGDGNGGFGPAKNFTAGSNPISVTTADFNGDGNADMAVANQNSGNVSVLLGDGNGGFGPAKNFAAGAYPASVMSADFNGDGKADMAVANRGSSNVSVLLGNGTDGFTTAVNFAVGTAPGSVPYLVTSADFNGDGKTDMAVANWGSSNVSVLLGDGNGGFATAKNVAVEAGVLSVTSTDFNGDGKADIAVASGETGVSVFLGNGKGGFVAAVDVAAGVGPESVTSADFNGDGNADMAVADWSGDVSVLLGDGLGGFAAAVNVTAGTGGSASVTSADFNGDGNADMVVANWGSNDVSVFLGDGQGGFATARNFMAGTGPTSVTSADFNSDGNADIAVANGDSNDVSVLLGDGKGGFATAKNITTGTYPYSVTSADFNDDGNADMAVANFGSNNISVLLGDGQGGFATAKNFTIGATGASPVSITSADFNGDGKMDMAVANNSSSNVSVFLGNGAGGFATAKNFTTGTNPSSVTTADFNGDGNADITVANSDNTASVLLGDGQGGFATALNFNAGVSPSSITTADFNGDGRTDIAMANSNSNNVSVLLNQSSPPDVTAPTGTISINTGSTAANSISVTLTLSCSDDVACTQMQFSNDKATWKALVANSTSAAWTMTTGADGIRTVYARFKDTAGNVSATVSDTITLDTVAPAAPSITAPANNTLTNNTTRPVISGTAEANASVDIKDGVTVLGLVTATGGSWSLPSGGATLTASVHSFTATATDQAGNTGPVSGAVTYTVETTLPTLSSVSIASNNADSTKAKAGDVVTITFIASEILNGEPTVTIATKPATVTDTGDDHYTAAYTMLTADTQGTVAFTIAFTDAAGNAGVQVTAVTNGSTVVFDSAAPLITTPTNITVEATASSGTPQTNAAIAAFLNAAVTADAMDGAGIATNNAPATFPLGTTTVTFYAIDATGNIAPQVTATVTISDTTPPIILNTPLPDVTAQATDTNTPVSLAPPTATDLFAVATISSNAPAAGFPVGTTVVTWTVTDANGNVSSTSQNVIVSDTIAPVITLTGSNPVTLNLGQTYTDAGATATDNVDGNLTASIIVKNTVNTSVIGTYTVTYNVSDAAENAAVQATRTVNIVQDKAPVITITGGTPIAINQGAVYSDSGAMAIDDVDGDLTASIVTINHVNNAILGSYTVTYNVSDTAGNAAIQAVRTVDVIPDGAAANRGDDVQIPLSAGKGTVQIASAGQVISGFSSSNGTPPAGLATPLGELSYSTTVPAGATTQTVYLTFSRTLPSGFQLYKVNKAGVYSLIPKGAGTDQWIQVNATTVALTLTDGGQFDLDGSPNGIIIDPLAITVSTAATPATGGGGGCAINPTARFDPVMVMLLLSAVYGIRRRRKDVH